MNLGFATAAATGIGVYYVYGEKGKIAAISAVATGAVLYAAYWLKLRSNPKINGFMGVKKANNNNNIKSTKNIQKLSLQWTPLSDEEIQNMKNSINR